MHPGPWHGGGPGVWAGGCCGAVGFGCPGADVGMWHAGIGESGAQPSTVGNGRAGGGTGAGGEGAGAAGVGAGVGVAGWAEAAPAPATPTRTLRTSRAATAANARPNRWPAPGAEVAVADMGSGPHDPFEDLDHQRSQRGQAVSEAGALERLLGLLDLTGVAVGQHVPDPADG